MADTWGPVEHPVTRRTKKLLAEGTPTVHTQPGNGQGSPPHPDTAAGKPDSSASGWESVDHNSGPVSDSNWEQSGEFPDSGVWKQT